MGILKLLLTSQPLLAKWSSSWPQWHGGTTQFANFPDLSWRSGLPPDPNGMEGQPNLPTSQTSLGEVAFLQTPMAWRDNPICQLPRPLLAKWPSSRPQWHGGTTQFANFPDLSW